MATPLYTFQQKTPKQIHDDLVRSIKQGLIRIGVTNPNVGPNSDIDIISTAVANELAVVQANAVILADQLMPDTAAGAYLDRWLAAVGLARRGAVGSSGVITVLVSAVGGTTIITGAQLVDTAGLRYQVLVGGIYLNGATVPVGAIDVGAATNHNNGDVLRWAASTPPFTAQTVTVGVTGGADGLAGGADNEVGVDEPPRARLFAQLQNAPKGGNYAQVAQWAVASSPNVSLCCVYPALAGPATVYFAVSAAAQTTLPLTSTSKSRAVPATIVSGTVVPYVQGLLPEHIYVVGQSTSDQPTNVAIQLSLPSAPTASPPGPGGGWLDGQPWPSSTGGTTPVWVTSMTDTQHFTVNATTPPTAGVTHICWLSPYNWTLYSATVLSFTGTSGAYVLTIDTAFTGLTAGVYIFPAALNTQNYVNALFQAFANLGPGEWSTNPTVLARGYRRPVPSIASPYALGAAQLKTIILSGPEVLDAAWIYRGNITPYVPTDQNSPPCILVPNWVGFYAV